MAKDRMLLAVLIDADNIPAKYAGPILREVTTYANRPCAASMATGPAPP